MIVFYFPPAARAETEAFSVVGRVYPSGGAVGELMLVPAGALPVPQADFPGCIFYLDAARLPQLPFCGRTLLPEALAPGAPGNPVYVSSRLSGGTLRERLSSARERFGDRLWLVVEPFSHFFPLPCPSGCGAAVPAGAPEALSADFFSEALCCHCRPARYHGMRGLYLFDTERSLCAKLSLADACGVSNVFLLPLP